MIFFTFLRFLHLFVIKPRECIPSYISTRNIFTPLLIKIEPTATFVIDVSNMNKRATFEREQFILSQLSINYTTKIIFRIAGGSIERTITRQKNPYWYLREMNRIYPNIIVNHNYIEYRNKNTKEVDVDTKTSRFAVEYMKSTDVLILATSDGNTENEYGFRNLVDDAIKLKKSVIVISNKTPNKYYINLEHMKKIKLVKIG